SKHGRSYAHHSQRRGQPALLDRIASHLRCGVYYCLSGPVRDGVAGRMKKAFPILAVLTALLLAYAFYEAIWVAPTERTMGDVQRIFYYHVPSAWTAFVLFFVNFVASVTYLARRNPKADAVAVVSAEVGVVFCTMVL